jgi:predicted membrane protein
MNKPFEFWAVIIGMMVWFFIRIPTTESLLARVIKTLGAAALGFGLCHDVATYLGVGDALSAVLVMAFGMIFLDAATSLFANEKFMSAFLRKRLGVDDEDK